MSDSITELKISGQKLSWSVSVAGVLLKRPGDVQWTLGRSTFVVVQPVRTTGVVCTSGTQDCIQCTPSDDHVHKSTELWRLDTETGEVKRRRVTCYAHGFDGDHDWRLEWFDSAQDRWRHGGYTNADAVFDSKRYGWTDVRVDALKDQVEWWLRRANELGEAATKAMADVRRAEQRAFSVFDELERECRREE